jgi:hypothetical protein
MQLMDSLFNIVLLNAARRSLVIASLFSCCHIWGVYVCTISHATGNTPNTPSDVSEHFPWAHRLEPHLKSPIIHNGTINAPRLITGNVNTMYKYSYITLLQINTFYVLVYGSMRNTLCKTRSHNQCSVSESRQQTSFITQILMLQSWDSKRTSTSGHSPYIVSHHGTLHLWRFALTSP